MILYVLQTNNERYGASFEIIQDGYIVGSAALQGHAAFPEGSWQIAYLNWKWTMCPLPASELPAFLRQRKGMNAARPYRTEKAVIYLGHRKSGVFKPVCNFVRMESNAGIFETFSVGCGKEGIKSPLFEGDRQVALAESGSAIFNDLHHYRIAALDETAAREALNTVFYCYVIGAYHAGKKTVEGKYFHIVKTTAKELKAKYDPLFLLQERNSAPLADEFFRMLC